MVQEAQLGKDEIKESCGKNWKRKKCIRMYFVAQLSAWLNKLGGLKTSLLLYVILSDMSNLETNFEHIW